MTILDDIPAHDQAVQAEIDAVLGRLKDAHNELVSLMTALDTSKAARQVQAERVSPVVMALAALAIP